MTELSRYVFDVLRRDEEFILYRGRSKGDASQAAFASRLRQATARPESSETQSALSGHDDLSDEALAKSEALAESGYGAPSDLGRDAVSPIGRDDLSAVALAKEEASRSRVLALSPLAGPPAPEILKCLEHEYSLREELDPT